MNKEALAALRAAGGIAAAARELAELLLVPGAQLRDVCEAIEAEILGRGAGLAFPVQTSVNQVAAHYCPSPEDETSYQEGDLAKLDIGVHVDGWVVDTAMSVSLGPNETNARLIEAARRALRAGLKTARPGIEIAEISAAIESTITSFHLRPMRNLCGHGVGRWTVHCPPAIPNISDGADGRLAPGMVVAIEPFATDGWGLLQEQGPGEVFRLDAQPGRPAGADPEVIEAIRAFRGLPFARRHLTRLPRQRVETTLRALGAAKRLRGYPPLAESTGGRVAQAEHTILVGETGIEILTE